VVGTGNALLTSNVNSLGLYDTLANAEAAYGQSGAGTADGTSARHVQATLSADAPLLFWGLLSLGQNRKTSIAAAAIAGISAPLCTACAIEPFAVAAVDSSDLVDFGFVPGNIYTFAYSCSPGTPAVVTGTTATGTAGLIRYLLIDRSADLGALPEDDYLFALGANGLLTSATPGSACSAIGGSEVLWAGALSAATQACTAATPVAALQAAMCGLSTRLTTTTPTACQNITNVGSVSAAYPADPPTFYVAQHYSDYDGNGRRLITVPVVETLTATAAMTVVGFRQFLLEPNSDGTIPTFADGDGRFLAMYPNPPVQSGMTSGAVAPVKQGRFDGACAISTGPGKVVLYQ
jgi:hypothetical protein